MRTVGVHTVAGVAPGRRTSSTLIATAAVVLGLGLSAVAPDDAAARTVKVREHVKLKLVKKSGSVFTHRGSVTGTVPGSARSRIRLSSLSLSGTVTIRTKGGSRLNLKIKGTARSAGLRTRFSGTATMAGGTGRYAKARGRGRFDGVVNRRTWAATIDASGALTY